MCLRDERNNNVDFYYDNLNLIRYLINKSGAREFRCAIPPHSNLIYDLSDPLCIYLNHIKNKHR